MVKTGHPATAEVLPVVFRNRDRPALQLETLMLSELVPRIPMLHRRRFQRLDFHLWVAFTAGTCQHMVDFDLFECRRGTVLHVRPGQVHRWDLRRGLEGHVLVMTPALMPPVPTRQDVPLVQRFLDDDVWPPAATLSFTDRRRVTQWFERLEVTARESDDSPASTELLRHLVAVTLLDVFRSCRTRRTESVQHPRMRQFRLEVERSFQETRAVRDYATTLRCSAKSLDRTCRATVGMSAKTFVDARVVLEAKRHLVHTDDTVEHIASGLGFTEPTNFVKFFRARTRTTPGAFRRRFQAA